MTRPRLLDLYCGAGGAARGYQLAGFHVTGVDNRPQPRYVGEFHQGDALEFAATHGAEFDAIHASPPCHDHTTLVARTRPDGTGDLLPASENGLRATESGETDPAGHRATTVPEFGRRSEADRAQRAVSPAALAQLRARGHDPAPIIHVPPTGEPVGPASSRPTRPW